MSIRNLPSLVVWVLLSTVAAAEEPAGHHEIPTDPYLAPAPAPEQRTTPRAWVRGAHTSVQVNVDVLGGNIPNDAANEPSIAADPTNPLRMVIGWRQFDNVASNFRQAGWGFTTDGGQSWKFPGKIEAGVFRSDPVLTADSAGNFYYYSLASGLGFTCHTFKSTDGGATWGPAVYAVGGDKAWLEADRSGGLGDGRLYGVWNPDFSCCAPGQFNRSIDGGESFEAPVAMTHQPIWGTIAVGPEGEVYVVGRAAGGNSFHVTKSTTIHLPGSPLSFDSVVTVALGGDQRSSVGPNPGGILGQLWIGVDSSPGPRLGWVYVLASLDPPGSDPADVLFVRSTNGGTTWSAPKRINDDPAGPGAWQWFGTMSVASNGRIDAVWNDTRANPGTFLSELTYSFSTDGGTTWSANEPVSPAFDPHVGWPQQNKIGDYYHMVSDSDAAHVAYSATFNGEQDVYYLRLRPGLLFTDGFESGDVSAWSAAVP